jgi:spore coat protein H
MELYVCRGSLPAAPRKDRAMVNRPCNRQKTARNHSFDDRHLHEGRMGSTLAVVAALALALIASTSCGADAAKPQADAAIDSAASQCSTPDPTLQTADAADLFAATRVPVFDFYLPAADWESLKVHARDEQYVSAQACYDGRAVGTVGLRFKGSYGSLYECFDEQGNMICPRLSMKVKFDKYASDRRFFGLKRLAFNAYLHDDSRMKEKLAYDLFRAMDIVAPRSAWAVLRVNGESQGVFGMVEAVDGRFTADRWPTNPDGNLYKELWPTHASDAQILAALETNEETADISGYRAFAQAFTSADDASLLATLGAHMDLDQLARFLAVEDAVVSYDGVTYFWTDRVSTNNHNYFIYEDSPTRFTLIPWDVESTFWINPDHAAPHWTVIPSDCSVTYPYWGGLAYAPACDGVFRALNGDLDRWRTAARALLDGPFAVDAMVAAIDRYAGVIGDAAHADPTPAKYLTFDQAVSGLRDSIPSMRARLEGLIAPPAP